MILDFQLADLNSAALTGQRVGIITMGAGVVLAGIGLIGRKSKSAPPPMGLRIVAWIAGTVLIVAGIVGPILFWPE